MESNAIRYEAKLLQLSFEKMGYEDWRAGIRSSYSTSTTCRKKHPGLYMVALIAIPSEIHFPFYLLRSEQKTQKIVGSCE